MVRGKPSEKSINGVSQKARLSVTEEAVGPSKTPASQKEFEGMAADSPVGQAAEDYVAGKDALVAAKEKLQALEDTVIAQMKAAGRRVVSFKIQGSKYTFEVTTKEEKLRCSKKRELALI